MIWRVIGGVFIVTSGAFLFLAWLAAWGLTATVPLLLTHRPLDYVYGSTITIDLPAQEKQVYFKWCDSDGYMMWANGFEKTSPITAVKDDRCRGVH